ncbi:MAG: helix-turn-helix transcriptional regulator [Erysipelotrichales bacterium]|nr:helix-turn-helix transcriptional regulator [Erysipelotrichales bacterium]
MELGKNIATARKQKNISQEELANLLNVSRQSISLWETDQTTPTLDKLESMCSLLDVSMDMLTGRVAMTQPVVQKTAVERREEQQHKTNIKIDKTSFVLACLSLVLWIIIPLGLFSSGLSILFSALVIRKKEKKFAPYSLAIGIIFFIASIVRIAEIGIIHL